MKNIFLAITIVSFSLTHHRASAQALSNPQKAKEEYNGMRCEGEVLDLPTGHSFNRLYLLAAKRM